MATETDPEADPSQDEEAPPRPPRLTTGLFNIADTVKTLSHMGVAKTKVNPAQGILMGWQATAYLAFAAFMAWMIATMVSADLSEGLGKFLSSAAFGLSALVLVILYGSNLVTGDYMTSGISLMTRRSRWREVLWEWSITHSGHWMAGFAVGWMIIIGAGQAGPAGSAIMEALAGIGETKVNELSWDQLFYRGILANWLIAMGVWGAYRTKETVGKVLLIAIPVSVFFAIGFEHSIVNHFALAAGIWAGADYTWGEAWFNNLVPVTLGNIVGAMILQGMVYWYVAGMPVWLGPDKWKRPHGSYRDLVRAIRDTGTLMLFFVAMAPLAAGALFLYGVEPALGISAGVGNQNWIEPIGISLYLVATALVVKRFLMPRVWHRIPDS
ncbi:MAG: formate/nitrite transporter family protein [Thaumarchaeota archaeon]|nr:formate/nitrite transporter family protein [Nitrososphaerota archaeon]